VAYLKRSKQSNNLQPNKRGKQRLDKMKVVSIIDLALSRMQMGDYGLMAM
jgi:hypothetical protein